MTTKSAQSDPQYQLVQQDSRTSIELELHTGADDTPIWVNVFDGPDDLAFMLSADKAVELAHALLAKAMQAKAAGLA